MSSVKLYVHNTAKAAEAFQSILKPGADGRHSVDIERYRSLLPAMDDVQWAAVLRSASAFEMYRKRFGRISPDRIVEFLLLDRWLARQG